MRSKPTFWILISLILAVITLFPSWVLTQNTDSQGGGAPQDGGIIPSAPSISPGMPVDTPQPGTPALIPGADGATDMFGPAPAAKPSPPAQIGPPPGEEQAAPIPAAPGASMFSKEKILEAYQQFMRMSAETKKKVLQPKDVEATQQAQDNPIWRFHSWLQDQLARMEEEGQQAKGQGIESLCFVCHNGQMIQNWNFSRDQSSLKAVLDLTSRHPVRDSEKSGLFDPLFPNDPAKSDPIWERKLQCTICHNPGVVTGKTSEGGYPLTLPTEPALPVTQKLVDGWPTLDNPPWPHDTPPKPLLYGRPYADDTNPDGESGKTLGLDEAQLPDFTTFCQTCHRQIAGRYGVINNYSRLKFDPIRYIKGDGGGTVSTHGMARGRETATEHLRLKEPFYSMRTGEDGRVIANLYLACTDCHEPHGSENPFLIRTKVNGVPGVKVDKTRFFELCNKCHYIANPWPGGYPHGSAGDMRERSCTECHNHAAGGGRF